MCCVFILRKKNSELTTNYKTWGYPITPLLFLALTGFTIYFVLTEKPVESLLGLSNVAIGAIIYFVGDKLSSKTKQL